MAAWPFRDVDEKTHRDLHAQGQVMLTNLSTIETQITEMRRNTEKKHDKLETDIARIREEFQKETKETRNDVSRIENQIIAQKQGGVITKDFLIPIAVALVGGLSLIVAFIALGFTFWDKIDKLNSSMHLEKIEKHQ